MKDCRDLDLYFVVEQAIFSPRDNAFVYRFWSSHLIRMKAEAALRQLPAGRLIECKILEIKETK